MLKLRFVSRPGDSMLDLHQLFSEPRHLIVICGGAVSGSEAAAICAERGIIAVVLEQNARPYGKIVDGLPRWHEKLRQQEYTRIDHNLTREGVYYVPLAALGREHALSELRARPGVAAVLLANGAWRDRPLQLPGIEALLGKGFVYQNPFVYGFNHYEDPGYTGPEFKVEPGTIVVGGGLASVDVAKIINLELYRTALAARGVVVPLMELEHIGIPKTLAAHGLNAEALGIEGATIYYRRRVQDMPIAFPKDDSPEQLEKTSRVREKMVQILAQKYLLRVKDCHIPVESLSDGERLTGLRFRKSRMEDGRLKEIAGSEYDVPARLVVSSIGSVPEPQPGIPTRGELYDYADESTGALRGLTGVFGLGNVLTGKGNIHDSRENAREISTQVLSSYLGLSDEREADPLADAHASRRTQIEPLVARATLAPKATPEQLRAFFSPLFAHWQELDYAGDYPAWIARHRPG
jgi:ferredoxin/flavodoxin---NADP+ reductase